MKTGSMVTNYFQRWRSRLSKPGAYREWFSYRELEVRLSAEKATRLRNSDNPVDYRN